MLQALGDVRCLLPGQAQQPRGSFSVGPGLVCCAGLAVLRPLVPASELVLSQDIRCVQSLVHSACLWAQSLTLGQLQYVESDLQSACWHSKANRMAAVVACLLVSAFSSSWW